MARKGNNFDFIRLAAATGVLVAHSFPIWTRGPEPLQVHLYVRAGGDVALLANKLHLGFVCVHIFFALSGYLVAESWLRDPNPPRFLMRRVLRLCPALYVNIVLSVVVASLLTALPAAVYWTHEWTWNYLKGFLLLFMRSDLPGVFLGNLYPQAFNGPYWTIEYEVACYLMLMLFGLAGIFRSRWTAAALALVLIVANWTSVKHPAPFEAVGIAFVTGDNLVRLGALFFMGAAFRMWRDALPVNIVVATLLLIVLDRLVLSGGFWLVYPAALSYVLVALGEIPNRLVANVADRFGDYSYGIYLYAWPVQQTVAQFWRADASLPEYIAVCAIVTFAFAFLSWRLVEKPALGLKPRRSDAADLHAAPLVVPCAQNSLPFEKVDHTMGGTGK